MATQSIYVTQGAAQYVGGTITDTTGKDISTATYSVILSVDGNVPPAAAAPGWAPPTVSIAGISLSQRIVKRLITASDPVGTWFLWCKITDTEILPFVLQGPFAVE
jgi:hypothetical protein